MAHSAATKGNDQVRMEVAIAAQDPKLEVLAPVRTWNLRTVEDKVNYARKRRLPFLPGTIGLIQATETIKVLLKIGTTLAGRLLTYDALDMSFRQFKLRRDPDCKTCGPNAHIDLESIPEFVCALQTTQQG